MDIRWRLYLYVVVNCVLCVAKPVSLNEVIAAESQKQVVHAASPKLEELAAQQFTLNKGLKPLLRAASKFKETGTFIPFGDKISSLKNRKTFQIKSPLRPKRIKHTLRRHNHKNQAVKREISGNEKLNQKYIPLLRSLSMLFDNLLADSGESAELRSKQKRVRYYTDTSEILCPCSSKINPRTGSEKTAVTSTETISDKASPLPEASSETAHLTPVSHFRGFRQNKNIPVLLPRNTNSGRRDDNGFRERSRTTHNGSSEGNISRNHGDSEHGTRDRGHESDATDDEEDPSGHSRDHVRFRPWKRIRDGDTSYVLRKHTQERHDEGDAIIESTENESTLERPRGNLNKLKREDKQQIRRDEAESAELLSTPVGRLRGLLSADKVGLSKSELEKSESHTKQTYSSDQQLAGGGSTITEENKETGTGHETVELNNIPTIHPENLSTKNPVVIIFDGYSVTRNKNGENKLKEKTIRIHS